MKLFDLFATLTLDTRDFERDTKGAMATARNLSSSITNSVSASTVALGNLMAQGVTTLAKTVYGSGGDLVQSSASLKAAEAALKTKPARHSRALRKKLASWKTA